MRRHVVCCMLHVACFMLYVACCMLYVTYCCCLRSCWTCADSMGPVEPRLLRKHGRGWWGRSRGNAQTMRACSALCLRNSSEVTSWPGLSACWRRCEAAVGLRCGYSGAHAICKRLGATSRYFPVHGVSGSRPTCGSHATPRRTRSAARRAVGPGRRDSSSSRTSITHDAGTSHKLS